MELIPFWIFFGKRTMKLKQTFKTMRKDLDVAAQDEWKKNHRDAD